MIESRTRLAVVMTLLTFALSATTAALADPVPNATATATSPRYAVAPGGDSRIVFESKAPLESFKGRTDQVNGWFAADLDDLTAGVELEVVVDLATFDTGKKKRNQHMRENHLETDTYPQAWFRGGRLLEPVPAAVPRGGQAMVKLQGELDLHGVARDVVCEVTLFREPSGVVLVTTSFEVKLSDHAIKRPKFLIMKLADEQQVKVHLKAELEP